MNDVPFVLPAYRLDGFNCPYCRAFAKQRWYWCNAIGNQGSMQVDPLELSRCDGCNEVAIWFDEKLIHPVVRGAAPPNSDLNENIRLDYQEAAEIQGISPRGAAALLRLCVQKLCKQLGLPGVNINDDIAELVKRGLPEEIKQALDVVRVVGNNAVHPGQINLDDDKDVVTTLFVLVNIIAERMISMPKQVAALHRGLPEGVRRAIAARDAKARVAAPPPRKP